ncbi:MAG TPA: hypothetical protein VLL25_02880 [Acidimicrobiales bacterium]|nr:hypothetical protein [Acidimicrobiales bacterium]
MSRPIAAKSLVNEVAEMDGAAVVLLPPPVVEVPLLDFFDELPHATNAVPIRRAVQSTPARFGDNLMLPPRWLIRFDGKEGSVNKV